MPTRRDLLRSAIYGGGLLTLRSLATGIPPAILAAPGSARAQAAAAAGSSNAQFLIFSTSAQGDPLNANVPGCYADANINHSKDPAMAPTSMSLSGTQVVGAKVWSKLPLAMLNKTCFFHHATYTVVHPDQSKVLRLQGATNRAEMLPSFLAANLAPMLGTVRTQAVSFGFNDLYHQGVLQPKTTPSGLASALSAPGGGLGEQNLLALRDESLDAIYKWAKARGKGYQTALVDQFALSGQQVRVMQQQLVSALLDIKGNDATAQLQAAMVLFKMKICPSVVVSLDFGGDNHADPGFLAEVARHQSTVGLLGTLDALASNVGLAGKVSFAITNVFGRTLSVANTQNGRDHNAGHAVSVIVSPGVKGSVVGGPTFDAKSKDYVARGIDSATGGANDGGDVPFADTFAAYGKTLARAVGLPAATVEQGIKPSKAITGVLSA